MPYQFKQNLKSHNWVILLWKLVNPRLIRAKIGFYYLHSLAKSWNPSKQWVMTLKWHSEQKFRWRGGIKGEKWPIFTKNKKNILHLSIYPSDLKQKCTQLPTSFLGTVFNAFSLGVIHFVRYVSLRNHFLLGWNSSTANQKLPFLGF